MNKTAIIIPARYGSTRLEGKPLLKVNNKSIIQYVWEASKLSKLADEVIVAVDDKRIEAEVKNFGGIIRCADAGSALDKAARGIAVKKYSTCWLMINYNSDYSTSEQLAAYLVKKIESYTARKITCTLWSFVRGKYIFCVVKSSE